MFLSIVTCTYNSERFLAECLASVVSQNLQPGEFEHIFIDAESTDATRDLVEEYKQKNLAYSVRFVRRPPHGIYDAMNAGLRQAEGEYVLFLNSDDFLEPNTLAEYIAFVRKTGEGDFYYGVSRLYRQEKKDSIGYVPSRWIYKKGLFSLLLGALCYVNQPAVIMRTSLKDRCGFFDENLRAASDWEYFIRLSKMGIRGKYFDRVVTNFRFHEDSLTTGLQRDRVAREKYIVWERHYGLIRYIYAFLIWLYDRTSRK